MQISVTHLSNVNEKETKILLYIPCTQRILEDCSRFDNIHPMFRVISLIGS